MPVYEYLCTACGNRADILHGINDPGPTFCPSCGRRTDAPPPERDVPIEVQHAEPRYFGLATPARFGRSMCDATAHAG